MPKLDLDSIEVPPVFSWLAKTGGVAANEMMRTFNCGIGMILVVVAEHAADVMRYLSEKGETVSRLGELIPGEGAPGLRVDGMDV